MTRSRRGISGRFAQQLLERQARGQTREQKGANRQRAPRPPNSAPDRNAEFELMLKARGIGGYVREYRFHPVRGWLLDFAWVPEKFAIEIDGGVMTGGKHVRPTGVRRDYEKAEALHLLGWRLYRVYPDMFKAREVPFQVIAMYVDVSRPAPASQAGLPL